MISKKLHAALLEASKNPNYQLLPSLLDSIGKELNCYWCSLWQINDNKTVSLIARYRDVLIDEDLNEVEYVHELQECLIEYVLNTIGNNPYLYIDDIQQHEVLRLHRSPERVINGHFKELISIPIPNLNSKEKNNIAILNIYPKEKTQYSENGYISEIVYVIRDYFAISYSKNILLNEQELIQDLIDNYERVGQRGLKTVFDPIINNLLRKYCNYEGCSVFIWNSFENNFQLIATTGLEEKGNQQKKITYQFEEGITGSVANDKKPIIINDLNSLDNSLIGRYKRKYREKTIHKGKSMMIIPILRPSNKNDVIGVIRFVNKINKVNSNVVDYFNIVDKELILHACNLMALYINYDQGEKEREQFIMRLEHETLQPALSIHSTVDRYLRNINNSDFIDSYKSKDYLESIYDHSELQIAQMSTHSFLWKDSAVTPRSQIYDVNGKTEPSHLLTDVILTSKKLVIYEIRRQGLLIDKIWIHNDKIFPRLYIDQSAFKTVFYNLLLNAIKYRKSDRTLFSVDVRCENHINDFVIRIRDNGRGITQKEKEKIFILGQRGEDVVKYDTRGLGIGLHIVKRIINDFGGDIRVTHLSNPTEFSIFLPKYLINNQYLKSKEWNELTTLHG